MLVRLRSVRRLSKEQFRLALDLVDLERGDWGLGDCIGQVTVLDGPRRHTVQGRGALGPAIDLYQLCRNEPPEGTEARLLWDMGRAVCGYLDRLFAAGVFCPFETSAPDDAEQKAD